MALLKRFNHTALSSAIRGFHAVNVAFPTPAQTAAILLSSLCFAGTATAEDKKPPTYNQWECRATADGSWDCGQRTHAGRVFKKPIHAKKPEAEIIPDDGGPQVALADNLDWVDEKDLTEEQRAALKGCCGAYVEPDRNYPESDQEPKDSNMNVASASTEVTNDNVAHLRGNVQLNQGYRQVRTDHAIVNQDEKTIDLEGNVQYREPGLLLKGDAAHANMDSDNLSVDNATYVMHEAGVRGTASQIRREDEVFYIDNATYTTCEPGNKAWRLVSSDVKINPETGIATAKHVRLQVRDIPVLYAPWLRFPLDDRRATGLLFPTFDFGDENGIDFAQPIYFNLAPNYDATFTPRYVQERGPMAELELRHMSQNTYTTVSGAFLSDDDGGDDSDEKPNAITNKRDHEGDDRWLANIDHRGGFDKPWGTRIDYTKVSDSDYFRDLDNATLEVNSQTYLNQLASVDYRLSNWHFDLRTRKYQTLSDDVNTLNQFKILPRFTANGHYRWGDFVFGLDNEYTHFDHENDNDVKAQIANTYMQDDKGTFITGDRLRLDYSVAWDKYWSWGFFRPSVTMKHLSYELDDPVFGKNDTNPSVTVPVTSLDTGLYFDRNTTWLQGYTQTFEPRLFAVYTKYEDQDDLPDFDTSETTFSYSQLFREDRFIGGDRIGDTEQVSLGLTTRLIEQSTGIEWFRASLGQIYYLDDRFVSLNRKIDKSFLKNKNFALLNDLEKESVRQALRDESNIAGELSIRLSEHLRFNTDALYDEDDGVIDKANVSLRYNDYHNNLLNLSYRFNRRLPIVVGGKKIDTDVEQADFSTIFPIFRNWRLIARYNYDLTNSRDLETFLGVEYDSCCWRVSLLGRRWLDRDDRILTPDDDLEDDHGIFFQFEFKGLAGSGKKVESILEDGIYGYDPELN